MKIILPFLMLMGSVLGIYAQITVNTTPTAQQLAELLAGSNLVVSNATLTGSNLARGSFANGNTTLGMTSGVILSTGRVSTAPGPNAAGNTSNNLGTAGTAQMTTLAGAQSYDAMTLEFDFTVQSDFIQFNYIFASEEYPEYAPPNNSSYNDVFAFFISGPGITGEENIALIPNTSTAVAINNINAVTNNQFYVDNSGGQEVSFDAFTTLLTARRDGLTPCSTYHLKLVIADAGDAQYNSAVLLQENSLIQGIVDVNTNTINSDNIALEGCIEASFTFSLDQPSATDKTINYQIAGTATNGVDYSPIASSLTIPAGQTQAQVFIHAVSDGLVEGQETILIIYKPEICSDWDTAFLYINDAQPITYTLSGTNLDCFSDQSGEILINASGGFPPYTYHVKDQGGQTTPYTTNPVTGLDAGQYVVYVYDSYGCKAEALVIGGLFNAGTTFLPDGSGAMYTSTLPISGFNPGQTLNSLSELQNICLNMEHSYMGDLSMTLIAPGGQSVVLKSAYQGGSTDLGEPIATGPVDGSASSTLTDPGIGYDYCFNSNPMYGTMGSTAYTFQRNYTDLQGHTYTDYYLPGGSYAPEGSLSNLIGTPLNGNWVIQVIDHMYLDNGYIFNWSISFVGNLPDTTVILTEPDPIDVSHFITQATCGSSNGAINVSVTGDFPPFAYLWSTGATTEDIAGLAAGVYTLTVSDNHGCQDSTSFAVSNSGSMSVSSVITPVYCSGSNSGAIDIQANGGTPGYSYLWSNAATTEDISGLSPGTYTVTITDAGGCQLIRLFEVIENAPVQISLVSSSNEFCSTANGSLSVLASGGSGSYGYIWSNGATTSAIGSLSTGTYSLTVTDAYGCTATGSWFVSNDVSNCAAYCYLDIVQNSVTNDACGQGSGSIDISVSQAVWPYIVQWSNGSSLEDIGGLTQGTYSVTVTDANQCVKTASFVVLNNTGSLTLQVNALNNETCGTQNGSIDISVSGGAMPYAYQWSNATFSEDVSSLPAGSHTVTVTDASSCVLIQSFTIQNDAGDLQASAILTHASCGASNGAITQNVTGGFGNKTFLWSTGSTTQSLSSIPAGTYTCTISDAGGCSLVKTYNLSNLSGPVSITDVDVTNEICGNQNGAINLTCSGTGLSYLWSNGAVTEDISALHAGTYNCTVSNSGGCIATTGPVHLFNSAGTLIVQTGTAGDEVCGNGLGYINIDVTGGTSPISYFWSNGSVQQDIYSLHAGTYTLTITDADGCELVYQESVSNQAGTLSIPNAVISDETCGNANGSIDLYVTGGVGTIDYLWSNSATSQDLSGLQAGVYGVTVSDAAGCQQIHSATVQNLANNISAQWQVTNEVCGDGTGSIDLQVSGGNGALTYTWSNASTTQDIGGLNQGTYICTISDQTACDYIAGPVMVGNYAGGMTVSAQVNDEICAQLNGAVTLSVSGGVSPYAFEWSNAATTQGISGLSAGVYYYTVTSAGGCSVTGSAQVNAASGTLSLGYQVSDEVCNSNTGAINLSVSGGTGPYTYLWNDAQTIEDRTSLSAGDYYCTVTDASGCEIVSPVLTVSDQPGTLIETGFVVVNEVCNQNNGRINLSVSGGAVPYLFTWSNGAHTEDLIGLTAGIYSVTVTDASGCSLITQGVVIDDNGAFGITDETIIDEHCNSTDGSVDISVAGGTIPYTYVWSNGATTQDISALQAGVYQVFVSDNGGCTDQGTYTVINQGSDLQIASASITPAVCASANGEINITVSGGLPPYTFDWSNGSHSQSNTGIGSGLYSLTITDASGCQASGSWTVAHSSGTLSASVLTQDEYCGDASGSVLVNTQGGVSPYQFVWNNGAITEDLLNISAGNYLLTITDLYGCEQTVSATVSNLTTGLVVTVDTVIDEHCGQSDGGIGISVSGGIAPIDVAWSNGSATEDIGGLQAGAYTVNITDATGCSVSAGVTVNNVTGGLSLGFLLISDEHCSDSSGFIDIEMTGGTAPYSYIWSNGSATQDLVSLHSGLYSVTVTDFTGCSVLYDFEVQNQNVSGLSLNGDVTDTYCTAASGSIDLMISGGIQPLDYLWSNGAVNQDLTQLDDGVYSVTVTDDAGCSAMETFVISTLDNPNLEFYYVWINPDYCGQASGEIMWDGLGSPSFTYFVNGVEYPFGDATGLFAGTYEVTLVDENGCSTDSMVIVENDSYFELDETHSDATCQFADGVIDLSVLYASSPTYLWSNGAVTEDLTGLTSGTYSCTVSEGGCEDYISVTIGETYSFAVTSQITNEYCGDSTGSIDLTLSPQWNPYYFEWSNGSSTEDLVGLSAGVYYCTITNPVNNCERVMSFMVQTNTTGISVMAMVHADTCSLGLGSIDTDISGGSGNYDFSWTHGPVTEDLTGLVAGQYLFMVVDLADGCQMNVPFEVSNVTSFVASGIVTDATCGFCNDGFIDVTVSGMPGFANVYSYQWSHGANTPDAISLVPGNYSLTVTSSTGCDTVLFFTVLYPDGLSDSELMTGLTLHPNPANEYTEIGWVIENHAKGALTLSAIDGRTIQEWQVSGSGHLVLPVQSLHPGTYMVSLRTSTAYIKRRLVIAR